MLRRIFVKGDSPGSDVNIGKIIAPRQLYNKLKDLSKLTAAAPRPMVLGFLLDARTSEEDALLPAFGVVLALVKESSEAPAQNPNFNICILLD